jgi:site-specific DNA-methyltransferase (adenine-specific)
MRDLVEPVSTEFQLTSQDCLVGMSQLPDKCVDVAVTSPPYNLGTKYGHFEDKQNRQQYLAWTRRWVGEVRRVLRDDGSFFLNVGASPANPFLPHEIMVELRRMFVLQNTLHWLKSITVETRDGQTVWAGHFKPINSRRFVTDCHEYIFHLTKTGSVPLDRLGIGVPYQDKSNIKRWAHTNGQDRRCQGNVWFIPYETIQSRAKERPHPATFPIKLPEMCIRLHGLRPGLTVLDPFLGIGSSALAALKTGFAKFIGFEIDEAYLAEARKTLWQRGAIAHRREPCNEHESVK